MRYRFPHERLEVWHVACDARKTALAFTETLPRGFSDETRQIRNASASVVRNICEGASRFKPREKVQSYEIAAGEAGEAAGAVQSLLMADIGDVEPYGPTKSLPVAALQASDKVGFRPHWRAAASAARLTAPLVPYGPTKSLLVAALQGSDLLGFRPHWRAAASAARLTAPLVLGERFLELEGRAGAMLTALIRRHRR